jgi:flagellar capping protein FliD
MKKLMLFLSVVAIAGFANAQKLNEKDVPSGVKTKFESLYPGVKVEKWEKEDAYFEAEFEKDEIETSVVFDGNGNLVETEVEINLSSLPESITGYFQKSNPNSKIKEASKITDTNGVITYEVEVDNTDYLFDIRGNFLKKGEEEKDTNEKEDK